MAEATQMIIFSIGPRCAKIKDPSSIEGKAWVALLSAARKQSGFQRLYWGLLVETPEKVQLHIVKDTLRTHLDFVASPSYASFLDLVKPITTTPPTIRHAQIREFSANCASLGKGAPVTGTAIYRATTDKWDAAWDLWSTIVPQVPGFMGIAGGHIVEEVDGYRNCFIALVGWENVEVHDHYHHTDHFRERRKILLDPADGKYNYYGHLAFETTGLETEVGKLKL